MNGRDTSGRFTKGNQVAKGNKGGPGRPVKKREERYLEITLKACTFEDWRLVVNRAVEDAQQGDAQARKWLSDFLLPAIAQLHQFSGGGGGPFRVVFGWDDEHTNDNPTNAT